MKPQRRVFLKVLASAPLVGCAGAADDGSLPGGAGVGSGSSSGSSSGGSASVGGQVSGGSATAGGSFGAGGNPFGTGGSSSGGNPFGTGGSSSGGNPFGTGGSSSGVAGSNATAGTVSSGTAGTTSSNPGEVVGNVSQFPLGSFNIADGLYFVGHDANGLFAMSMQCTHKGCTVGISGSELLCPCHGARFTRDGNVLNGPATDPLPHLALYVDASGNVSVDKYTVVAASARTKV